MTIAEVDLAVTGFEELSFIDDEKASAWHVRGTTDNHVDARNTNGTAFEALGRNDVMSGSDGDDLYDGDPCNDTAHSMGWAPRMPHRRTIPERPCPTTSP